MIRVGVPDDETPTEWVELMQQRCRSVILHCTVTWPNGTKICPQIARGNASDLLTLAAAVYNVGQAVEH